MRRTTSTTSPSTRTSTSRNRRRSRSGLCPGGAREGPRCRGSSRSCASVLDSYGTEAQERVGFFTDTSICIGCKACEVACKEGNLIPEDGQVWTGESYDNTSEPGANSWRHVAFVEQHTPLRLDGEEAGVDGDPGGALRWLMNSDVCKHCTHAACLDVCPTGALFPTAHGTVVVQEDVC